MYVSGYPTRYLDVVLLGNTFRNTEPFSVPFVNFSRISPLFFTIRRKFRRQRTISPLTRQNRALTTKFTANGEKRGEIREKLSNGTENGSVLRKDVPQQSNTLKIFFIQFLKKICSQKSAGSDRRVSNLGLAALKQLRIPLRYSATLKFHTPFVNK